MSAIATNHAVIEGIINLVVGIKPAIQWVDEPFTIDTLSTIIRTDQLAIPMVRSIEGSDVRFRVAVAAQAAIAASEAKQSDWPHEMPARNAAALLEMASVVQAVIRRLKVTEESFADLATELSSRFATNTGGEVSGADETSSKLLLVYLSAMRVALLDGPSKEEEAVRAQTPLLQLLSDRIEALAAGGSAPATIKDIIYLALPSCKCSADFGKLAKVLFPESTSPDDSRSPDKGNSAPKSTHDQPSDTSTSGGQDQGDGQQPQSSPGDGPCDASSESKNDSADGASAGGEPYGTQPDVGSPAPDAEGTKGLNDSKPEAPDEQKGAVSPEDSGDAAGDNQRPATAQGGTQDVEAPATDVVAVATAIDTDQTDADDDGSDVGRVLAQGLAAELGAYDDDGAPVAFGAGGPDQGVPLPPASRGLHSAVDGRLIMAMQKALQDQKIRNVGLTVSGTRVDAARLWRLKVLGDARIFRKPAPRAGVSASIQVLMDRSKSMHDQIQLACRITLALAEGFKRVPGTKTAIDLFPGVSGGATNLLPFGGQISRAKAQVSSVEAMGTTPLAQAIMKVMPALLQQKTERKILLIVSDGAPNDVGLAKAAIKLCVDQGIEVLGIGLGSRGALLEALAQHSVHVDTIDALPEAFASLFSKQILKG